MKAIIYDKYGSADMIQVTDIPKPDPGEDEILVKVMAASLNAYDWHFLSADIFLIRLMGGGLLRPKNTRLGADLAGRVESVGKNIHQFKPGDEVYGEIGAWGNGAFAEFVAAPERAFALKPANLSFEQSAAVPMAAITALQALRDTARVQPGQKVLINGASGGVGTFAVQIAKYYGAEVTAVCSTGKMEMVRSLGADHIIDYTKEDFTKSGQKYDLILAVNGYHPISAYKRALMPEGMYAMAGGSMRQIFECALLGQRLSESGGRRMKTVSAKIKQADLIFLKELLEAGSIVPIIDRTYPLSEAKEAMRYLGTGHARGKIVLTMA
ncbi:MAG TPA: NAD(P)-dependent alcohol dehydrogenase [Anaerolineales bacterium]|nr:NAD(P)-dependent alcohol dehydrogenase [Anaerolineales bacterium]